MAVRFQAHLQRGGIGLDETVRLLKAYGQHGSWEEVRRLALRENILGKTSDHTVEDILRAFKRRFLCDLGLPPVELVSQMVGTDLPEAARRQVLFPYFLVSDPLVKRCYCDLVLERLTSNRATLTGAEVVRHLETLSLDHPELTRWASYLRRRWARGFLTLLRRFGLMEPHPGNTLRRFFILPEPFAFFWLWFWERGSSFWDAWGQELWRLLQADERRRDELLAEGQVRGWWTYQRSRDIVHFQPKFDDLKGWIRNGLA
ncbi:MAG: hypothetical protein DRP94_03905 [Candidatus Latescibacterota bacterium]|nr:MAG: hypothetical protein DRP94_03905 [Candidatus Latescibacterota bacterium]RKY73022.1 MAG: hypothetical protein DRQ14_05055 [Candidatus Latescibacterota bacterium]